MILKCLGKPFDPESIKRWTGGEERRGRGEGRREEEKEGKARREKEQKGGRQNERGVPGANRVEQGEAYPTLKGAPSLGLPSDFMLKEIRFFFNINL